MMKFSDFLKAKMNEATLHSQFDRDRSKDIIHSIDDLDKYLNSYKYEVYIKNKKNGKSCILEKTKLTDEMWYEIADNMGEDKNDKEARVDFEKEKYYRFVGKDVGAVLNNPAYHWCDEEYISKLLNDKNMEIYKFYSVEDSF